MFNSSKTKKLVESAILISIAVVLDFIKFPGPWVNGGSITLCSMVPICIIGYRHGIKWGLISGFTFATIQMIFGINGLKGITLLSFILAIILDYLLAFTVLGLSGIFKEKIKNQVIAFVAGSSLAVFLRFLCHFISGIIVWDSLFSQTGLNWAGILYSLQYNGSYMLPELIITSIVGAILCKIFDFSSNTLKKKIQN